jgi:hypothetical protein
MARRGGKAGTRRDRQRRAQRKPPLRPAVPQRPIGGVVADAVEQAAERRAEAAPARAAATPPPTRGARSDPRFAVVGPSRLSERAASEYSYVTRDLRNIAVLIVVMGVLLTAAVIGFNALGIGPS